MITRGTDKSAERSNSGAVAAIHSLAVLPLENLSGDKDQEYFADRMTDALTTDLAQIGSLRVISRTSAMQFGVQGNPAANWPRSEGGRGRGGHGHPRCGPRAHHCAIGGSQR